MSNVPVELKYSKEHEWLRKEADGTYTVGITEHAQELLGDMVFVDLPDVGATVAAGDDCAVAESVKAASDIYAPVSGEIVAVIRLPAVLRPVGTAGGGISSVISGRELPAVACRLCHHAAFHYRENFPWFAVSTSCRHAGLNPLMRDPIS